MLDLFRFIALDGTEVFVQYGGPNFHVFLPDLVKGYLLIGTMVTGSADTFVLRSRDFVMGCLVLHREKEAQHGGA